MFTLASLEFETHGSKPHLRFQTRDSRCGSLRNRSVPEPAAKRGGNDALAGNAASRNAHDAHNLTDNNAHDAHNLKGVEEAHAPRGVDGLEGDAEMREGEEGKGGGVDGVNGVKGPEAGPGPVGGLVPELGGKGEGQALSGWRNLGETVSGRQDTGDANGRQTETGDASGRQTKSDEEDGEMADAMVCRA